jgi:hypothetical protein
VLWYIAIASQTLLVLVLREGQSEEDGDLYAPKAPDLRACERRSEYLSVGAVVAPSAFGMFHAKSGEYKHHVKVM